MVQRKASTLTTVNFPYQPMEFDQPLSLIDYYQAELEWRTLCMCEKIWDILDELEAIREILEYDSSPRPPTEFNLLQTQY